MAASLMNTLKSVFSYGVIPIMHYREQRQVQLTNYISFFLTVAVLVQIVLRRYFFNVTVTPDQQFLFLFFLLPILANRFNFTTVARVVLSSTPVFLIWYAFRIGMLIAEPVEQSMYDGIRLFLISVSLIPYLVFDRSRPLALAICILPALCSIVFFDQIANAIGIGYRDTGVSGVDFDLMTMRGISAYFIINIACYILLTMVASNDEVNQKLIVELRYKTEQIHDQNRELTRSRQDLIKLNQQLERMVDEKARDIRRQNEILANYAFTNAHKLRGPVARILGLINVSRLETGLDFSWFFTKMEAETRDIDRVIRSVSEDLDKVDHSKDRLEISRKEMH
jgi:signal transduction histidine kinase